jgi:hypothetical protein
MNSVCVIRVLVLASLGSAAVGQIGAQSTSVPATTTPGGGIGTGGGFGAATGVAILIGGSATFAGAPYTATRKTTHVQTLANGTTITRVTTVKEARDSEGRTYREEHFDTLAGGQQPIIQYSVFDPVARTMMNWSSTSQKVTLNHLQESHYIPNVRNRGVQAPRITTPLIQHPNQSEFQFENLGTKNINGIDAVGRRNTQTIPAGREGNDQPITITHEFWNSPELHIAVQESSDDPRTGTTTMELTDIDRNEPDPRLFQAPEGYTIREIEPVQPHVVDMNP